MLLPQYSSKQGIPRKQKIAMTYLLSVLIVNPTENNSVGGFKFLPDYQGETEQPRPRVVQRAGEGKWGLAGSAVTSAQAALTGAQGTEMGTLPPVNSRESSSARFLKPLERLFLTLKDCISSLSLQREIKILRLLVLVPKGRQNNNESLCIATPLFQVFLVFAQKVCVLAFFFPVVLGKNLHLL